MPPKRGRPRKQVTAEDVPTTQVKKEGKVKIVPRTPGRMLGRISKGPQRQRRLEVDDLFDYEEPMPPKAQQRMATKRRQTRGPLVEEVDDEPPMRRVRSAQPKQPKQPKAAKPLRLKAPPKQKAPKEPKAAKAPKPRKMTKAQQQEVADFFDPPTRGARVAPSNYNQTGALGAPIQIRPAFPGVQKPFVVQEFPRDYSNLSASVNPGIPQYLAATTSPGIPSPGPNFLQQPGPPQQLPPSAAFNKMMEEYAKLLQQQGQQAQYMAPQIEMKGMAPANVPQLAAPPEQSQAFAAVQDRAAAPPGQALAVQTLEQRQRAAGEAPSSTSSTISVNVAALAEQQRKEALRNYFVRTSARVQEWNQGVAMGSQLSIEDRPLSPTMSVRVEEAPAWLQPDPNWDYENIRPLDRGSSWPGSRREFVSIAGDESDPSTYGSDPFSSSSTSYGSDPFGTSSSSGGAVRAEAGGNIGWYRGTTPTMRAAGDKRLMAQYGPQMAAQRHMEQRVDYLGYAGTGLVRTTPVYEAGDVGWAEPPKGAATINTASYRGRAAVAIRDPNTLKVGQKATTGQTLAQQRLAAMYEQRVVGKPRLQMSGQPYFDNDVDPVGVTAAPAQVMPNAVFSKLRGSPPAI